MRYKRFYLKGSLSILGIFILIAPFINYYYDYGDVTCGEKCWTTFCMKNGFKNLYFYNKEELPLTFSPEDRVHSVKFFKKDGRFKTGYRPIDFIKPYSKGMLYVFKIPAYGYTCYGMEIEKDAMATVKWNFGSLDPVLIGVKPVLSDCAEWKNITYYRLEKDKQIIVWNETTKNDTIIWTYKNVSYVVTKCVDRRKVIKLGNKTIDINSLRVGVSQVGNTLFVDDVYDGNGDGICKSGESCCTVTDKVSCSGYNADKIKIRLKDAGIK